MRVGLAAALLLTPLPLLAASDDITESSGDAPFIRKSDIFHKRLKTTDSHHYGAVTDDLDHYFGADGYAWAFHYWTPRSNPDLRAWYDEIARLRGKGLKVQGRVEWDAAWRLMVEALPPDQHLDHVSRTLEGRVMMYHFWVGPGEPDSYAEADLPGYTGRERHIIEDEGGSRVYPPYWFSPHSPVVMDWMKVQVDIVMGGRKSLTGAEVLNGNVDFLMFDSQVSMPANLLRGGDFSSHAMKAFRQYLARRHGDRVLDHLAEHTGMSWATLQAFDYRDFLRSGCDGKDETLPCYTDRGYLQALRSDPGSVPLHRDFRAFTADAHERMLRELSAHADAFRDAAGNAVPNPPKSTSAPLKIPLRAVFSDAVDFYTDEDDYTQQEPGPSRHTLVTYKIAEALGKPFLTGPGPQAWRFVLEANRVDQVRSWIAHAYAHGANFMVPVEGFTNREQPYRSRPGDYEFLYRFIDRHPQLFDGYEPVAPTLLLYSHRAMENPRKASIGLYYAVRWLADGNVPHALALFGSDLWAHTPPKSQLEQAEVIFTTHDDAALTGSQQSVLDAYRDKVVLLRDEADVRKHAAGPGGTWLQVQDASHRLHLLPRRKPADPASPAVVHIVNYDYRFEENRMVPARNVVVRIRDRALFGQSVDRARLFTVDSEPGIPSCVELTVHRDADAIEFHLPHAIGYWGILALDLRGGNKKFTCEE